MTSNCVVVFHFPSLCVLMSISAAYVTIGSYISRVSTNYTFATVYKGRHTKEMSVIDEPAHVAVWLQLLEISSITTPNKTILNVCTRYNILSSALDKLLGQLGIYATWLSSIAYLQKQLRIFIFFDATFSFSVITPFLIA